ncbi:MBOAT family O-acyltransferase [Roseobacter sp. S98]|uniref:MBOAT family O-acyltransferase n=1 Tax=Roseobacter algicola (ex Choi et al. 2025) (nom. illeg.) TaxID=3092138 RepID=UPI003F513A6F
MVFSAPVFLWLFLPAALAVYFLSGRTTRNGILLAASLFFYAWGEDEYVLILIGSILMNYAAGRWIAPAQGRMRLIALWAGIVGNLLLLAYFKYTGFLLGNLNVAHAQEIAPALPIGISFFTFQALSYLVDLYFRRVAMQRNPFDLALYISLFPQLIAGPIVRYAEVETALKDRSTDRGDFSIGMERFVRGLAKKTLIADPMGLVADQIYAIPAGGLTPETAWAGAIAYSLQLYFDFSAYSDMAIGLGRILGFRFPENFNYPYASTSVTEFWRRWHMTLSRWFRDYLYIPLGGNRKGAARTYMNLLLVFLATGLWHGAAWTFVAWGLWHGMFLILERLGLARILGALPRAVNHAYLLVVVITGWVLFRAGSFEQALEFYYSMFLFRSGPEAVFHPLTRYLDAYAIAVAAVAIPVSVGLRPWLERRFPLGIMASEVRFWALFGLAILSVGAASYSPFIYFRF